MCSRWCMPVEPPLHVRALAAYNISFSPLRLWKSCASSNLHPNFLSIKALKYMLQRISNIMKSHKHREHIFTFNFFSFILFFFLLYFAFVRKRFVRKYIIDGMNDNNNLLWTRRIYEISLVVVHLSLLFFFVFFSACIHLLSRVPLLLFNYNFFLFFAVLILNIIIRLD